MIVFLSSFRTFNAYLSLFENGIRFFKVVFEGFAMTDLFIFKPLLLPDNEKILALFSIKIGSNGLLLSIGIIFNAFEENTLKLTHIVKIVIIKNILITLSS